MEMSGRTPNTFCSDKTQLNKAEHKFAGLYDDLTVEEVIVVRDFLLKQPVLNLTSIDSATVRSNYIQLIEFQQPDRRRSRFLGSKWQQTSEKRSSRYHHGRETQGKC